MLRTTVLVILYSAAKSKVSVATKEGSAMDDRVQTAVVSWDTCWTISVQRLVAWMAPRCFSLLLSASHVRVLDYAVACVIVILIRTVDSVVI